MGEDQESSGQELGRDQVQVQRLEREIPSQRLGWNRLGLENQITLESGTTSSGSLLTENLSGDIEAVLTEAGEYLVDEVDGDNILYEDDPSYVEYIILEDTLTDNMATDAVDSDNLAFDTEAGLDDFDPNNDIFDFTENNPFGDPRSK